MTEEAVPEFDGNDYRKRVLAAVERRGGPDTSDAFELYDLPPADDLDDLAVAEQLAAVWGFWQRQRDHPKYRVLVAQLVEGHARRRAELLDPDRRRTAAARVRARREQRDSERYVLLDAAVSRLVDRHGALPPDKLAGLHEVGALAGLSRDEVAVRLRRHRVGAAVAGTPGAPALGPDRRRQLRLLLEEFGRLTEVPATPSLLALLELSPTATDEQVTARAAAWRSRARELPPGRLRAVVDELLVHVAELLEPGRTAVERYLTAVAADVTEYLRPRVRAAILVEDRLVAEDHAHLLDEAVERGLDPARARAVLAAVAAELGAPVDADAPTAAPPPGTTPPRTDQGRWQEPLRAARAALRTGRPEQARRLVGEAETLAGIDGHTQVRAVADQVRAVLAEAGRRWREAVTECAARRHVAALPHLEYLSREASDLPEATELADLLVAARAAVRRAESAVASALAGDESTRADALLAVLADCPGHPGAEAALARIPVASPLWVSAARDAHSGVVVLWAPSTTSEVTYKVSRLAPNGSWQVVGRVTTTSMEDGGAPVGVEAPVYAVVAMQQGRVSAPCRSDSVPVPQHGHADAPLPAPPGPAAPGSVSAVRSGAGSVQISWLGGGGVEYRVRCLGADGRWRVVGRTSGTTIEDGGAPTGPLPVYAVSAIAAGGGRSAEVRSDG